MFSNHFFISSPLEPFFIKTFTFSNSFFFKYFTATNQLIAYIFLILVFVYLLSLLIFPNFFSLKIVKENGLIIIMAIYSFVEKLVDETIKHPRKKEFLPFVLSVYFFVTGANLLSLIPYNYAITGQIAVTLTLSLITFFTTLIIGLKIHKLHFFGKFFPGNLDILLMPILVPVEFISYLFQPISLAVRLFANIMAGHILIWVFTMFTVWISTFSGILSLGFLVPFLILFPLVVLEIAVAFIQGYVFCLLVCIYINDTINLH